MQPRNFKFILSYLISVAIFAFVIGCGQSKSIIKTRIDSSSTVKAKVHTDSIGSKHLNIDSLGLITKDVHLKYTDKRIEIFYNKPDSTTGKQSINHETIFVHTVDSSNNSGKQSHVIKNEVDSSHLKKDASTDIKTVVDKKSSSDKQISSGLNIGWKGYLIGGIIILIAGAVVWWKFIK